MKCTIMFKKLKIFEKFLPYNNNNNNNKINYNVEVLRNFHGTKLILNRQQHEKCQSFTIDEEATIVKKINKCNYPVDYNKYDLKQRQIKKLLNYKEKYGNFKTFDDLLMSQDITGFVKLCKSILNDGINKKSKKSNVQDKTIPVIEENMKKEIKTIVGLHVWNNTISWAAIEKNNILIDWARKNYENQSKVTLVPLINQVKNITKIIPKADAYVMEAIDVYKSLTKLKSLAYKMHLDRQTVITALISVLGMQKCIKESTTTVINNFFMLKPQFCANKFQLIVGNEIIAGDSVIKDILEGHSEKYLANLTNFSVDSNVLNNYLYEYTENREQLHSTLLVTLAFADIVKSNYVQKITSPDDSQKKGARIIHDC